MEKVSGGKGSVGDLQSVMSLLATSGEGIKLEPDALAALLAAQIDQSRALAMMTNSGNKEMHASNSVSPHDPPAPLFLPEPNPPSQSFGNPFPLPPLSISHASASRCRSYSLQQMLSPSSSTPSQHSRSYHHAAEAASQDISNPLAMLAAASEAARDPHHGDPAASPIARNPVHSRPVTELLSGTLMDARISSLNLARESIADALVKVTLETESTPIGSVRPRALITKRDLDEEWDPLESGLLSAQQETIFYREYVCILFRELYDLHFWPRH